MTRQKHTANSADNASPIVVDRGDYKQRVVDAAVYMVQHDVLATRANIARFAKRYWIKEQQLQVAMRLIAEEDLLS